MTRVAITDDFLRAYAGIPKSQQNKVRHFMEKFRADPTPASINYEPIHEMIAGCRRRHGEGEAEDDAASAASTSIS